MKLPKLLNDARQLAKEQWHSELTPLHLASVLLTFQGGLFTQAISTVGGDGAILSVANQLKEALKQHAVISLPPPQHIGPSPAFVHLRKCAQSFQDSRGDTEFGVEHIIFGILSDSTIIEVLKETDKPRRRRRSF